MNRYTKRDLSIIIGRKIKFVVHKFHIFSIVSILVDELVKELKDDGEIKIGNFGTFRLNTLKAKKIISVSTGKTKFIPKNRSLRFKLVKKLSKFLSNKSIENMKKSVEICEEKQEQ